MADALELCMDWESVHGDTRSMWREAQPSTSALGGCRWTSCHVWLSCNVPWPVRGLG